jgi:hypothetical protein
MRLLKTLIFTAAAVGLVAPSLPSYAEEGYTFDLQLTSKNASQDPDGVWDSQDLAAFGNPPHHPDIYTARLTTPAGEWLLSQTSGDCNMQTMCTALLIHKTPDGKSQVVANPQVLLGGTATLSLNYKKITTQELDESAKPFTGSYDVGAPK